MDNGDEDRYEADYDAAEYGRSNIIGGNIRVRGRRRLQLGETRHRIPEKESCHKEHGIHLLRIEECRYRIIAHVLHRVAEKQRVPDIIGTTSAPRRAACDRRRDTSHLKYDGDGEDREVIRPPMTILEEGVIQNRPHNDINRQES